MQTIISVPSSKLYEALEMLENIRAITLSRRKGENQYRRIKCESEKETDIIRVREIEKTLNS